MSEELQYEENSEQSSDDRVNKRISQDKKVIFFKNNKNFDEQNHHGENKQQHKQFFSKSKDSNRPRIYINNCLKEKFWVGEAKYDEECKCGESKYVELVFKCQRKKLYRNDNNLSLQMFEYVIVNVEGGIDAATVTACGMEADEKFKLQYNGIEPEYSVIRHAHHEDFDKIRKNKFDEVNAVRKSRETIAHFKLDMKVTEAEWQIDRQRLTLFFTAPTRIDFRDLVKELARQFKTRIELRQISTREEAKRIGGMGPCGLNLCCASFGHDTCHVTLDHAREQHLSNNVAKLSGYCGRLKCCLLYEHEIYVEVNHKFPKLHSTVETEDGIAYLNKIDVFKEIGYLYFKETGINKQVTIEELHNLKESGKVKEPSEDELVEKAKLVFGEDDLAFLVDEY